MVGIATALLLLALGGFLFEWFSSVASVIAEVKLISDSERADEGSSASSSDMIVSGSTNGRSYYYYYRSVLLVITPLGGWLIALRAASIRVNQGVIAEG